MTENEAIKEIKCWLNVYAGSRIAPEMVQATGMAIKALEEVQQYQAIGTHGECVRKNFTFKSLLEAREKQTPKKPDLEGDGYGDDGVLIYDTWICPCCGKRYEIDYEEYDYCPNCGQAIDWSARNEDTD